MDILGGSGIIRACRRVANAFGAAARESFLLKKRGKRLNTQGSFLAHSKGRVAEALVGAVAHSPIAGWLYRYWGRLAGMQVKYFALLFGNFLLLGTLSMLLAGRYALAGGLGIALLLACALIFTKGTLADWLEGTWLGQFLVKKGYSLPRDESHKSIPVYLAACGLIGGAVAIPLGLVLGALLMIALAGAPVFFALPPLWSLCILCAALPLAPTAVCWGLSVLIVISYLFGRAFRGMEAVERDWMDILLLVFPVLCLISTLFSFQGTDSAMVTVMWMGLFVCVFAVKRILRSKKDLIAALSALTAGALFSGLYGLLQALSGMTDSTWTDTNMFADVELRVYSTFANPNVFGEFLLLMVPLVTSLVFYVKKPLWKWILMGIDGLLLVNLVLTYSRGCYVGLALTAVVFLWQYSKKWLLAALAIGIPVGLAVMPASVMNRLMSIGDLSDGSTNYRMMIYTGTLLMLADYWFSGVGIGEKAYNAIYPLYALSGIAAPHAHSLFFQSAVSFGLVGLVYIMILLFAYQRQMTRHTLQMERRDRFLMLGFGSLMAGFALQSVFDYTWYNYRVFQLFWIVLALGFAAVRILKKGEREDA